MNDEAGSWGGIDAALVISRSREAFVVMDEHGIVREWNTSAERMFGFRRDEAVGARLSELIIPPRYRDLHERGIRTYLDTGVGPVIGTMIEIEGVDREGRTVPVELTINAVHDDEHTTFHAFLNDITHRRRTERFLRADARAAWLCAAHPGSVDLIQMLAAIGEEMAFGIGLAWLPDARNRLLLRGTWAPTERARSFAIDSEVEAFERGVGLPGSTWERGEPIWSADVSEDVRYVRRPLAKELGFHSGLFVPIGRGRDCSGVLEFLTDEWRVAGDDFLERFGRLGDRLGQHLRP